ncbi:type II secretion system major pseudopilin GspG [Opitutia bacterium ISCC 51]|nr:type II secretion system major pseudopilin GspG [Opitutae bacterium ISCC 51]QXD27800.1 type II secretion system major pseudopilin GspG [Opitutae bacterium ISCC 52]
MNNVKTHKTSSPNSQKSNRRKSGFTLMEILLVMALLGGLVVLGLMNVDKILGGGQEDTVRIFVNDTMKASLFRYRIDNGRYPNSEEGIQALVTAPSNAKNWKGPYMDEIPSDPWGSEYQYRMPGKNNPDSYDIYSFGKDGVESADDIGNWQ